jgi:hypothetical protein
MLIYKEWKEIKFGKNHRPKFNKNGICDGTCDSCLQSLYTEYVRNNKECMMFYDEREICGYCLEDMCICDLGL